ncbi:MAG: hypothetical protein WCS65_06975 [Verrucomicrobiae bacterium]
MIGHRIVSQSSPHIALPPEFSEPLADADSDGTLNLLEFALGGDPKSGSGPTLSLTQSQGRILARFLMLDDGMVDGMEYVVQSTGDLKSGA